MALGIRPILLVLDQVLEDYDEQMMFKYLQHHANQVEKDGVYLELLDLLFFAHETGMKIHLTMNTECSLDKGRPASAFVEELFDIPVPSLPPSVHPSTDMALTFICTRADYKACDKPWELNHWMPCIESDMKVTDILKVIDEAEAREKQTTEAALAFTCEDEDPEAWENFMEYLSFVSDRSVSLKRLVSRCHTALGLFPVAVPADGNCGAWSMTDMLRLSEGLPAHELLSRDPFQKQDTDENLQRMLSFRQSLADMWRSLTVSPQSDRTCAWWQLFRMMILDAGGEPMLPGNDDHHEQARVSSKRSQWCGELL